MREDNIYVETQAAKMLEFDTLNLKLQEYAYTEQAKEEIRRIHPSLSESEVIARLHETSEAKIMIEKCGNPPITSLTGIEEFIMIAGKGGCLTGEQLEIVA
ncbi:MAG: hypothetical protein PUD65_10970, partial [Spirochaetales bacterium]|nr:hypothetical protein [Spirochaetales bacterium]